MKNDGAPHVLTQVLPLSRGSAAGWPNLGIPPPRCGAGAIADRMRMGQPGKLRAIQGR